MERRKTRPALELGKLIPGVLLVGLAVLQVLVLKGLSLWTILFIVIGGQMLAVSQHRQACVDCRRSMKRREYAFSPWVATKLREAIEKNDAGEMAEIVRGPRIDHH